MNELKNMLLQEKRRLENIIKTTTESAVGAPEGYLRISKDKKHVRYYHCTDDRYGKYISKEDVLLPKRLAQKIYDDDILRAASSGLKNITKFLKSYSENEIEQVYRRLNSERQALVTPVEPTMEQLVEQWYNQEYSGKEFAEDAPVILSDKGERVRSKSEKIIADWLYRNDIKYLYEKPLNLRGYGIIYPDFTFLSCKTGKEIYWEHDGMMDNPEYANSAVKKIELYEKNGIYPGENLILTFETSATVLNSELVKDLALKYLI